jgi:hypothetical protein
MSATSGDLTSLRRSKSVTLIPSLLPITARERRPPGSSSTTQSVSLASVDDWVNSEEGGNRHVVDPLRHEVTNRYQSHAVTHETGIPRANALVAR